LRSDLVQSGRSTRLSQIVSDFAKTSGGIFFYLRLMPTKFAKLAKEAIAPAAIGRAPLISHCTTRHRVSRCSKYRESGLTSHEALHVCTLCAARSCGRATAPFVEGTSRCGGKPSFQYPHSANRRNGCTYLQTSHENVYGAIHRPRNCFQDTGTQVVVVKDSQSASIISALSHSRRQISSASFPLFQFPDH
jgi:hypothetical protein